MNSRTIIDIPPRIIRPQFGRSSAEKPPQTNEFGGGDQLRALAQQIVHHDPTLALLLARAGERVRRS